VSTVSRVINGSTLVAAKKRKLVEAVIDEMGYTPAPMEKRKGVRKDFTPWIKHRVFKIVLFGPFDLFWITNYAPVYSYALHGIDEALRAHEFQRPIERAESPEQLMRILKANDADGYLILNTHHEPLPAAISDYPAVAFMGAHEHLSCDRVMTDPEQAGRLAAHYLHSKGCRLCLAIGGDTGIYRKRINAFTQVLLDLGVECIEVIESSLVRGGIRMHQVNRQTLGNRLSPLIGAAGKPVGVFSVADILTPVLYQELTACGLKIGEDTYVVSCNGERPYLDALHPQPAVIDINGEYLGKRAVQLLMKRLEAPRNPHEKVTIAPKLILPS
jgi:DNA-binding LacI/PurR family transcriptional regulator